MELKAIKKKRIYSLIAILIGLPLALVGAASQSMVIGVVFGCVLALGIDGLIDSFRG